MDIHAFLGSPAGIAAQGILVAAFLDFLFGVIAAVRDGTFDATALAAFLRKHIVGRVFPIVSLLAIGYASGNAGIVGAAAIAGAAYVTETLASVYQSLNQAAKPSATSAATANPVPLE